MSTTTILEQLDFEIFRRRPIGQGKINHFYATLEVSSGICTFAIDENGFIWWRQGEENLKEFGFKDATKLMQNFFSQNLWAKTNH